MILKDEFHKRKKIFLLSYTNKLWSLKRIVIFAFYVLFSFLQRYFFIIIQFIYFKKFFLYFFFKMFLSSSFFYKKISFFLIFDIRSLFAFYTFTFTVIEIWDDEKNKIKVSQKEKSPTTPVQKNGLVCYKIILTFHTCPYK